MWTVRAVGGAAFHFGTDAGDVGAYAGADLGYRLASGWGVAAFYRYELCRFDRTVPTGLLEDEGNWHHIGLKATFEGPLGFGGRLYAWAGLGGAYSLIENYQADGDGFGGFAELGIGYKLAPNMRAVFGVNVHGIYTSAVRLDAANDEDDRLLWTVAPVIGLEIGF